MASALGGNPQTPLGNGRLFATDAGSTYWWGLARPHSHFGLPIGRPICTIITRIGQLMQEKSGIFFDFFGPPDRAWRNIHKSIIYGWL